MVTPLPPHHSMTPDRETHLAHDLHTKLMEKALQEQNSQQDQAYTQDWIKQLGQDTRLKPER